MAIGAAIAVGVAVAAGGAIKAYGEKQAAEAEAVGMEQEADELLETAGEKEEDLAEQMELFGKETETLLSRQQLGFAASGVAVGGGSAETIVAETEAEREAEGERVRKVGQREIEDLEQEAQLLKEDAETARDIAKTNLIGGIIGSIGSGIGAGMGV